MMHLHAIPRGARMGSLRRIPLSGAPHACSANRLLLRSTSMKPHITFSRVTHSRRTFVLTALFLGLLVMAPAYGQESNRDRMALPLPAPLADSTRPLTTGTELIVDGDFESGYYGGSLTSDTSGVTGPWQGDKNPSFNNP